MNQPILIVGGSVRAAAMSAKRAGYESFAIDRYTDDDLCRICQNFKRFDDVTRLPELANGFAVTDFIFVGPLENHPAVVEQLRERHRLLGTAGDGLVHVRDPWQVADTFHAAGLPSVALHRTDSAPQKGEWLLKPLASAGGFDVAKFDPRSDHQQKIAADKYLQQFVSGKAIGVVFVGDGKRAATVGATEQLVGTEWGGSRPFQYVGSIGLIDLLPNEMVQLQQIGNALAQRFQLKGLFGIDAIVNDSGVWPVEVNPRYTASIEIIERASDIAAMRMHVDACCNGQLPLNSAKVTERQTQPFHGKAIVYAERSTLVSRELSEQLMSLNTRCDEPAVADIPAARTKIGLHEPITTVFAAGDSIDSVKDNLRRAIDHVKTLVAASN